MSQVNSRVSLFKRVSDCKRDIEKMSHLVNGLEVTVSDRCTLLTLKTNELVWNYTFLSKLFELTKIHKLTFQVLTQNSYIIIFE